MAKEQDKEPVFVPLYFSYLQTFEPLSDDQLGRVVRAVLKKYTTGEITDLEPIEQLVMNVMSRDVDKALEHYKEVSEERRKAVNARWERARKKDATDTNVSFVSTKNTNGYKTIQNDTNDTIEKEKEKEKEKENNNRVEDAAQAAPTTTKRKRNPPFRPPTVDEVKAYCVANGYDIDAEYFVDYYEQNGWMVGRNKMKSWEATVRNWSRRDQNSGYQPRGQAKPKRDPMLEYLDNELKKELAKDDESGNSSNLEGIASILPGFLH